MVPSSMVDPETKLILFICLLPPPPISRRRTIRRELRGVCRRHEKEEPMVAFPHLEKIVDSSSREIKFIPGLHDCVFFSRSAKIVPPRSVGGATDACCLHIKATHLCSAWHRTPPQRTEAPRKAARWRKACILYVLRKDPPATFLPNEPTQR